jgi:hypothetical protein
MLLLLLVLLLSESRTMPGRMAEYAVCIPICTLCNRLMPPPTKRSAPSLTNVGKENRERARAREGDAEEECLLASSCCDCTFR